MRRLWNIIWRVLVALLLLIYVAVAAVNYSVVQSYIGAAAGRHFSREWGATVRIGSIEVTPWDHLSAHNILLVSPDDDTIFDAATMKLKFRHFPYKSGNIKEGGLNVGTLELQRLYLANAYYHFASISDSTRPKPYTNLQFIIDHYSNGKVKKEHRGETFTVKAATVILNHVHYRMDLPDKRKIVYPYGVQIPHMEFFDIRARIKDVHVVNDNVTARIVTLSTEERSGFKVDKISAAVHVSPQEIRVNDLIVETPRTHISLDALLEYDSWEVMNDYLNTVMHSADIRKGTSVAMSDVAYWAPVLWGIEAQINPCGTAHGTVNDLHTDGLRLDFGRASQLALEGRVRMVEKIDSMEVDIPHLGLRFEQSDLSTLRTMLPQYITPQLAQRLDQLGYIDLGASVEGGLHRHSTANLNMVCALGNLHADADATPTAGGYKLLLDAGSDGLGLTPFGSDYLSHTAFALSGEAEVSSNSQLSIENGELEVQLMNSVLRGRQVNPVLVKARLADSILNIEANCRDSLLAFSAEGAADMGEKKYNGRVELYALDSLLSGLPFNLATNLRADLCGNTVDSLNGSVNAAGTHLQLAKGSIDLGSVDLEVRSRGEYKRLRVESDPLSLTAGGHFNYADLPLMVRHFASQVLPEELALVTAPDSVQLASIADRTLTFTANWNDRGQLLPQAGSTLNIAPGTRLSGSYNQRELLKLALRSDSIRLGSILLDNFGLSSRNAGANYIIDLESQEVNIGTINLLRRLEASLGSNARHAILELLWGEEQAPTRGDLMLRMADGAITVERPDFYIGDTRWRIEMEDVRCKRDDVNGKLGITGEGISLASGDQSIEAGVALRGRDDDRLILDFHRFNLGGLCQVLLQETPLDVEGRIGGHFEMYGLNKTPYFNAALKVDSCIVNQQALGDVAVRSTWNAELGTVNLDLGSDHIAANGWIGLGEKDPALNLAARFNSFDLALAAPFLKTFSSRFEGVLHGNFDISGTLSHPVILGEAMVEGGALKVDLTGVTYYFDDNITFNNAAISLGDFILRDQRNNLATINGEIRYSNLENITLDLGIATDNLLLLDQRRGDDFYGTLLAAANATITGPVDDLDIDVIARTNTGCNLTVPLSNLKHVKTQNYITFVSDNQYSSNHTTKQTSNQALPLNITIDLTITPDLQLNLPMDFSELRAAVGATGAGDLHILLDHSLDPFVTGSYEIIDGDLKLSMLSLIEKNFSIENGSNIAFNGSLPNARFDLRAVYSQRANLSTLTGSLSTIDNTQKYIQVDDIISIAGTLQEPTINFDLRLPNADQSVQDEVFSYIDRNSERDMINQTVSLLLLGQFYNVSGTDQNGANAASGGIGTVASAVGSLMADMVQIVDINVDYKAATDYTNQQLDVNISKDWGRWYLESTLGYGGEGRELETTTNGTVLDALIGYRISPLVHLFAYNRTNTNDYTRTDLPYKQGIGLKLTKDFDSWAELFGHSKKATKKKQ